MSAAPRWFAYAKTLIGTREIAGPKHSAVIMGWIKKLGAKVLGMDIRDDETPWCGTFMAHVMSENGIAPPPIASRASAWANWGRELLGPRPGCVLVFTRSGGGHVGMYVGERANAYRVLGGNQGDAVSEVWVAKNRLAPHGMRWPSGEALPAVQVVKINAAGKVSSNEA